MRIGLLYVSQESGTFNPTLSTRERFEAFGVHRDSEVIDKLKNPSPLGGHLSVMEGRDDVETVPIFKARAVAGGRISRKTFDWLTAEVEEGLARAGQLDAVAFHLHGACAAEGFDDVEGALIDTVRRTVGSVPIVVGLDHHANITEAMISGCDALVGHRTQPHDLFDTGVQAANLLLKILDGAQPVMAWRKLPLLSHQEQFLTSGGPMKTWFDRARALENRPEVLAASNFPMQPWLDVAEGGWSTVVVTDDDAAAAESHADELAELAWTMRDEYQVRTSIDPDQAVRSADNDEGLTILSDTGDSVLGGAGGDSTVLIATMIDQGVDGPALATLVQPDIAEVFAGASIGESVTVEVGGQVARMHNPIKLTGTIQSMGPATIEMGGNHANKALDLGLAVVFDTTIGTILITEWPGVGGVHPDMYLHFDISPGDYRMAVVKTASNFQYMKPFSTDVIRVNTPGPTQSDIALLPWKRIPRPVFPLDEVDDWRVTRS